MTTKLRAWALAGVAGAALSHAPGFDARAFAADLALLVDNTGGASDDLRLLGDTLNARGYEVYDRTEASRQEMAEVVEEIARRLGETDRLVLVFAGETRTDGESAWLMPAEYTGDGRIAAVLRGLPLDLFLDLAARVPGRAAVVVGTEMEEAANAGEDFLSTARGIGGPAVPQGVLLISGEAPRVAAAVRDGLLAEDRSLAAALRSLPRGVEARGFISPERPFVSDAPGPVQSAEAPATTVTPEAPQSPTEVAEAREAALGLDRPARQRIQERLTVLGYSTRGIDGIFGPGTRSAIREWQEARGFEATGYLTADQLPVLAEQADARSAELAAEAEEARREEEAADAAFWRTTGANGGAADLRAYLGRYPDGLYAAEARSQLDRFEATARADAAAEDRAAWEEAEAADEAGAYRSYLESFPQGAFAGEAEARIAALSAEPERAEAERAAAATETELGLGQGSLALIEGQLASLGYAVGAADGTIDADTRRALREFQTRQGLEPTGYVDQQTVQALIVASLGLR